MNFDFAALDAAIDARVKRKELPGVSVAIHSRDGLLFHKGYGFADVEAGRAIDADTVMGVASMSKSMTTLALAILEAEGKFSFDDPVVKYFPNFRVPGNPVEDVTCRHLATHTAGIPPMEPLEWSIAVNTQSARESKWREEMQRTSPNRMDEIGQIVDYIAEGRYPTLGQAGEIMSYSNEGYAILSYIADIASGTTLEAFLKERVFGPIGMTRSVLDLDGSEAKALAADGNITRLYGKDENGELTVDDEWSVLPPFRGCACVKSTARDMARYYQCISDGGVIDGVQAIPAAAAELLVGSAFPEGEKPFYCLGLNKRVKHGSVICEHAGGLHGVSSFGGMLKGEGFGFSALCNKGDEDTDDICWMMYNAIMGRPLEEDHRWLHPAPYAFSEPGMLTGGYICHEGMPVVVDILEKDGKLVAQSQDGAGEMVYCGGTWFTIWREGKYAGRVRFLVREGKAWAAMFYTRVYRRLDQ
ncbi:MAG: Penicillin-binding protein 4* [Firmicutes bacterium ADurb.Bin248]|nr:MAG: Penicillin-binding protein 4* [Firmicutes bacterium ADurb.Bin248]HPK14602.1 serine hydrolase [Clostridia bacterium]